MLRRQVWRLWVGMVWGTAMAAAQTRTPRVDPGPPPVYGSVNGHVYLAGSEVPARFAKVGLQPFDVKDPTPGAGRPPAFSVYQTDLDGSFRIDHVRPGAYYVVVNSPGCLSPFAPFSKEELMHPSPEAARRIAAVVPAVEVRPNATSTITLRLRRGASLSGTVRFDDGTPYPEADVSLEKHDADGKWARPRATESYASTDLNGHWTISGLPPGEYRVHVSLSVQERHQDALLGDSGSTWNNSTFSVPVYAGDTARERDAKTVTLEDGQQMDGEDISIPVSRMHTVTGAVVDAKTGQSLNAGHVALVYADDGKEITSVPVEPESHTFTIPFVPEGTYKLTTRDAREVRFEDAPEGAFEWPRPSRKEIVLRQYGPGEMPVVVQGDMSSLNLPVEVKAARAQ